MITDKKLDALGQLLEHGRGTEITDGCIYDLIAEARRLRGIIRAGYKTDPGTSDLDDEQPIAVWMTLGDYRRAGW